MKFGWINLLGALIVALMLIPNIAYAIKNKEKTQAAGSKAMQIVEQLGRYACIILMWLPLLVGKFGFPSIAEMVIYLIGNSILLITYHVLWFMYMKQKKKTTALALAIIPAFIFFMSGFLLRHWLLLAGAVLFAIGHIYLTWKETNTF